MTAQDATAAPDTTMANYAGGSARVGVQAGVVHGDVYVYETPAGASPAEMFEIGVRLLAGGIPGKARELIGKAVMDSGLTGNRVCFHWQLALVSGRTRHEMPQEHLTMLHQAPGTCDVTGGDAWADGVRTLGQLLESAQRPDEDLRPLLKDLDELADPQRSMILRHLQPFLDGPLENQMWRRALDSAEQKQMANGRTDRVWKFFEPKPARPRVREPRPPDITAGTWVQVLVSTTVVTAAAIHIAYLLVRELQGAALLAYLLSIGGGYCAARGGVEWRFRFERRRAKDQAYAPWTRTRSAPSGGFADEVGRRMDHYFARYVPRSTGRSVWLADTAGIRRCLRDEIVEVYREQRIGVERIAWLIRYRVGDVRTRWENDTLWNYRRQLATPPATKLLTILGLILLVPGVTRTLDVAVRIDPLSAVRMATFALPAAVIAAHAWLRIVLERWRYAADHAEKERTLKDCEAAFERWKARLADKPSDSEMAAWLDCDRKMLLDEALRHYRLTMSGLIAHALIETRGSPAGAHVSATALGATSDTRCSSSSSPRTECANSTPNLISPRAHFTTAAGPTTAMRRSPPCGCDRRTTMSTNSDSRSSTVRRSTSRQWHRKRRNSRMSRAASCRK
ncbi:hypothetical protein [Actinomadura madurae]|uniref:hypothetical protein n=1 Tax=Actinomadura madurae TaxID=1993 RepID=UPI0020D21B03|nr:hypothetical protein [Actinomadura madurae]MCQ0013774.1 hypothetical protein [Actinomadura madurae]